MITNNISFQGYNNVMYAFDSNNSNDKYVASMSLQLNNEDGFNDLLEYKKLREMNDSIANPTRDDILTLTYIIDKKQNKEQLFLNSKEMYWGDELRALGEKFVPKLLSQVNYKREEAVHMKAYTLIASLTKRLAYAQFDNENGDKGMVIQGMFNSLYKLFQNQHDAFRLTELACSKKYKFQGFAEGLNKGIVRTMNLFFR